MVKEIIEELQGNIGSKDHPASERKVAKFLGVSHDAVNSWKNGDYAPTLETVNELLAGNIHAVNALQDIKRYLTPKLPVVEVSEENVSS